MDVPNSDEKKVSPKPVDDSNNGGRQDITSALVPLPNKSCWVTQGCGGPEGVDTTADALISAADGGNGTSNASAIQRKRARGNSIQVKNMVVMIMSMRCWMMVEDGGLWMLMLAYIQSVGRYQKNSRRVGSSTFFTKSRSAWRTPGGILYPTMTCLIPIIYPNTFFVFI